MRRVADGLYQIDAAGTNVYLIEGPADLTLVDAGPEAGVPALLADLQSNGFRPKDIQRVMITHAHAGHAGGLNLLLQDHRFKIYAHPFDIPALTGKKPSLETVRSRTKGFFKGKPFSFVDVAMPVETGIGVRGLTQWQILHLPGHTAGSLGLFHPARQILICGDALANKAGTLSLPKAESPEDGEAALRTARMLAALDCDVLCCGHGPVLRGGAFRFIEKLF
ncbi:MAG: MBL fold metallo-hydrolase [Elusimicrobiota bacterium]|jgi:glyoxylase-like metal-dependent hydrolase (beta-lactamase superfamily II)